MIHVVFSDNEKSTLKSALSLIANQNNKDSFKIMQDAFRINVALDVGSINCDFYDNSRKEVIASLFEAGSRETPETISERTDRYWESYLNDYNTFIKRVQLGESIRIWYSEAPYSLCGFYATAAMLAAWTTSISAIKLPSLISSQGRLRPSVGWGEISPSDWRKYLYLEKSYTKKELLAFSACWEKLKTENASLRAIINGHLYSVPDNFYDAFILKTIDHQPLRVSEIILRTMNTFYFGIGDSLIAKRITELLKTGKLKMLQKKERFYDSLVNRSVAEQSDPKSNA